jgi:serine/threonine protein kinase
MSSLFKSVNHIHSVSIIHRDIKPCKFYFYSENILLPNEKDLDKIKMADFGLSTKLDFHYPKTATSKCGTMLFMAP